MSHSQAHGKNLRELTASNIDALSGHGDPGKFGRMFPNLEPLIVADDALLELANAMVEEKPVNESGDNNNIPAGFTYFGQFVDHDITLDTTPLAVRCHIIWHKGFLFS